MSSRSAAPAEASLLPASVAQLATVIGWPGALALVEAYPGQTLDLPKHPAAPIWAEINRGIGNPAYLRLYAAYAGQSVYLPACSGLAAAERNRLVRQEVHALERSVTTRKAVTATARKWRLTERTIWRVLAHQAAATTQSPGFTLFQLPLL